METSIGNFEKNKHQGQGTMTYANGDKFVGEWKDYKEFNGNLYKSNGELKFTYRDGIQLD